MVGPLVPPHAGGTAWLRHKNMKYILGTKQNMTQIFDSEGIVHPVTVLAVSPLTVTQIKNTDKDGYISVQVGFGDQKPKNINNAQKGHVKDLGNFKLMREFKVEGEPTFKVGDKIDASILSAGETVTVSGISKGKGFQGVVKRHGFHGGPRSHGQKHSEREPGSVGGGGRDGGRIAKGKRMGGRMGAERITVKNLKVIEVDSVLNQVLISGAIPGRRGTLVEIRTV